MINKKIYDSLGSLKAFLITMQLLEVTSYQQEVIYVIGFRGEELVKY